MRSRLTVVETAVWEPGDEGPATAVESRFEVLASTDEQPYVRRLKVGQEWQRLEMGWLKGCSMLFVQLHGAGALEVKTGGEVFAEIRGEEAIRLRPRSELWVRSVNAGEHRCTVTAFPAAG